MKTKSQTFGLVVIVTFALGVSTPASSLARGGGGARGGVGGGRSGGAGAGAGAAAAGGVGAGGVGASAGRGGFGGVGTAGRGAAAGFGRGGPGRGGYGGGRGYGGYGYGYGHGGRHRGYGGQRYGFPGTFTAYGDPYGERRNAIRLYGGPEVVGQVRAVDVQRALRERGYYQGPLDGRFGASSVQALDRFRRDRGIEPAGYLDRTTADALRLGSS